MLTHKGTQTIKTERLILRQFTPDDAADMYNNWASDERVTKFLAWQPHESPEATRELLIDWCKGYESPSTYNWAMTLNGSVIGSISVISLKERSGGAELGYCMGYDYWNKGYMTEAARAVIDFLFKEVGMHRITISHAVKNPGSGRVAQKCGLTREGVFREAFLSNFGEYLDIAVYAILRDEWEYTLRKALVKSYLGKTVDIEIDRPIGYVHNKEGYSLTYPINYGFIPGVLGGDGEELDVYLLGVTEPVSEYRAKIIGIAHRNNDVEDKLIGAPENMIFTEKEITEVVHFQEQYYDTHIEVMLNDKN